MSRLNASLPNSGAPTGAPVAIVTGAGSTGSGIGNGRAASILLARRGYSIVAADLKYDLAQETAQMIEDEGGQAVAIGGDVSKEADCRAIVESTDHFSGPLKALVNNVGITEPPGNAVDIDIDGWNRAFAINVTSMLLMSKYSIPKMITSGGGRIVNVSSVAGTINHSRIAYATTKGAVLPLTRSIAAEYGPHGIRANVVVPGFVYTPLVEGLGTSEESRQHRANVSPLKTEGTGWDIGSAITYLATEDSSWITGIAMPVDAGFSADLRFNPGY